MQLQLIASCFGNFKQKSGFLIVPLPEKHKNVAEVDIVCSERVCQGHSLCKVSHSQLSQMQRKANFDVKINKVNGP